MAVLTLLPGIVHILQERENSRMEIQFIKTLQLKVQERTQDEGLNRKEKGEEGGIRYEIRHLAGESCIHWETKQGAEKEFCFQVH